MGIGPSFDQGGFPKFSISEVNVKTLQKAIQADRSHRGVGGIFKIPFLNGIGGLPNNISPNPRLAISMQKALKDLEIFLAKQDAGRSEIRTSSDELVPGKSLKTGRFEAGQGSRMIAVPESLDSGRSEVRGVEDKNIFSDEVFKREWDKKFSNHQIFQFDDEMNRRWNVAPRQVEEFAVSLSPFTRRLRVSSWVQDWDRHIAIDQDPSAFNFTKVSDSEKLFKELELEGSLWNVLVNKGPRKRYDALLVPQKYSRQLLTYEDVKSYVIFLRFTEAFIFYNSL